MITVEAQLNHPAVQRRRSSASQQDSLLLTPHRKHTHLFWPKQSYLPDLTWNMKVKWSEYDYQGAIQVLGAPGGLLHKEKRTVRNFDCTWYISKILIVVSYAAVSHHVCTLAFKQHKRETSQIRKPTSVEERAAGIRAVLTVDWLVRQLIHMKTSLASCQAA